MDSRSAKLRTPVGAPARIPLVTQPSPILLTRNIKRRVAVCPLDTGDDDSCKFAERKPMKLHATAASAEVEAVRHIRNVHNALLSIEVKAQRKRQVVNEQIELVGD